VATNLLKRLNSSVRRIEEAVLSIGVVVLAALLIANAIARKTGTLFHFVDELSMFLVIMITFLGVSYAVREASHVRMAALYDLMPEKAQKRLIVLISGVSSVVLLYIAYLSVLYVLRMKSLGQMAPTLGMPYWIGVAIVPVGFFLASIQYGLTVLKNIRSEEVWVGSEKQSEYE
jgi:TRAP-type C4-dicarboxylate transport system permease small subunit